MNEMRGWVSIVGVKTDCKLDSLGFEHQRGQDNSLLSTHPDQHLGPLSLLCSRYCSCFPWVR